jgi:L-ascorbate metabolism protein UlaG (beta-lactamase superfamily)
MQIRYHGHSCFELSDGASRVLVDPFLKPRNPVAVAAAEEIDATLVALSHGHVDHLADARAVAQRTGAPVLALAEVAIWLREQGVAETFDPNLGGTVAFPWGWVKLVQAFHTNTMPGSMESPFSPTHGTSVGQCAGLVINIGGVTVYYTGDTCLFGDMELIARRTPVDVALMPIGGHYTMDRHDAVVAAQMIGAKTVIPVHYDTFPPIKTDAAAFKADVESQTSSQVVLLAPGETHEV